jgi:hypothetical protein
LADVTEAFETEQDLVAGKVAFMPALLFAHKLAAVIRIRLPMTGPVMIDHTGVLIGKFRVD